MFGGLNVFTGDEGKVKAQVAVWCEELQEFPLYAIRQAAKWAVRSEHRLPSIASFIGDVRLAVGGAVLQRRLMLDRLECNFPVDKK